MDRETSVIRYLKKVYGWVNDGFVTKEEFEETKNAFVERLEKQKAITQQKDAEDNKSIQEFDEQIGIIKNFKEYMNSSKTTSEFEANLPSASKVKKKYTNHILNSAKIAGIVVLFGLVSCVINDKVNASAELQKANPKGLVKKQAIKVGSILGLLCIVSACAKFANSSKQAKKIKVAKHNQNIDSKALSSEKERQ